MRVLFSLGLASLIAAVVLNLSVSAYAASLDAPKSGVVIDLPDRWDVDKSYSDDEPWGHSFEVNVSDSTKRENFILIVTDRPESDLSTWTGQVVKGALSFLKSKGSHIDLSTVRWRDGASALTRSGEEAVVKMSSGPVRFENGEKRYMAYASFHAGTRHYLLFVYNGGKAEILRSVSEIIAGITATPAQMVSNSN